jgi:hypothetical protein
VVGNFVGVLYPRSDEGASSLQRHRSRPSSGRPPSTGRQHWGVEGQREGLTGDTNDLEPGLLGERFAMWDSVSRPSP